MKQIARALRPLTNRMHFDILLRYVTTGLVTAGAISLAMSCISLLSPVSYLVMKLFYIYGASLGVAIVAAILKRPDSLEAAMTADALGAKERLVTAMEMQNEQSSVALLQRADALSTVKSMELKRLYPFKLPYKRLLAAILLAFFLAGTFLIPTPSREQAAGYEKFRTVMGEMEREIQAEGINPGESRLVDADRPGSLELELAELKKRLEASRNEEEAMKALLEARNEFLQLQERMSAGELNRIAEKLEGNPLTEQLADALKRADASAIKNGLKNLENKLGSMSGEDRKQLADTFKKAAGTAENEQLKNTLSDLGKALESGDSAESKRQMSNLENCLEQQAKALEQQMQQMKGLLSSIDKAGKRLSEMQANNYAQTQGMKTDNKEAVMPDINDNRVGGDPTASEAKGSDPAEGSPETADSGESAEGSGSVREYDSVYVPERLGGESRESQVTGAVGDTGESRFSETDEPVEITNGSVKPYDRVLGEYKSDAMKHIQSAPIPEGMKQVVMDYFTSLE